MKAIKVSEFGQPDVMKLISNLEIPKPSKNQVLIEVKYAGVNPVDTYRRSGNFNVLPKLPWTPGSDCSGTILEVNSNIASKFTKGQRVYTSQTDTGAYSTHTLATADQVHVLPDHLTFQQGAAIGIPYFTAYSALFQRGNGKAGETVLIHGASGAVGIGCIQMAKARNLIVIGTAGTEEGLKLIKELGADYVFNHKSVGYQDEIKEKFGGKINLIIEMLANKNIVTDCEVAAVKGRIMIVGNRDSVEFDFRRTMVKLLDIRGVALVSNTLTDWQEAGNAISHWLENGSIKPVIAKEYELADAPQAHHDVIFNSGTLGKLVLKAF